MASAPDVVGAAREQGRQARASTAAQTAANRPSQSNAWGGVNWSNDQTWVPQQINQETGEVISEGYNQDNWTQNETLNPFMQASLDAQQSTQLDRSELAQAGMDRVRQNMQNPMDFDQYGKPIQMGKTRDTEQFNFGQEGPGEFSFGQGLNDFDYNAGDERQKAEDASYGRSTSRLDPQFQQREQALQTKLRNQGLQQGDQAYDAAMGNFGRSRNDAYEQARMGATSEGRTEAGQNYGQALGSHQQNVGQQQQLFGQALGSQQQNVAQQGQAFGQAAQQNQMNNQLQNQEFGQATTQNQMANALRTQGIQEGVAQRAYPLNEVNSLLSNQQITGGPPSTGATTQSNVPNANGARA